MSFLINNLPSMVISWYLSLFPSLKVEMIVGVLKVLEVDSTVVGGTGTGIWDHKVNFECLLLWRRCDAWEIKLTPAQSPLCLKTWGLERQPPSLILNSSLTSELSVFLGCAWLLSIFLPETYRHFWYLSMFPAFTQSLLEAPSQDFISSDLGYMVRVKQVFWPWEWFYLVSPNTGGVPTLASHTVQCEIPGWRGSMSCIRLPGTLSVDGKRKGVSNLWAGSCWVHHHHTAESTHRHPRATPPKLGTSQPRWKKETKVNNFKCWSPKLPKYLTKQPQFCSSMYNHKSRCLDEVLGS